MGSNPIWTATLIGVIVQWSMHVQLKNMSVRLLLTVLKNAPVYLGVINVRFVVTPLIKKIENLDIKVN